MMLASMAECEQTRTLLRAKIQQFPDIHAVSAEILALRGGEALERKEGGAVRAVAFGAALRGLSLASQSVRHLVSSEV